MKPTKERLKEAMDHSGWSINRLRKHLKAQGVRGSSYGSVRNYLGRTQTPSEPPLEFLLAAAEAMGVNPEYLAHGKEHLTAAHEASAAVAEAAQPDVEDWKTTLAENLRDAVLRELRAERPEIHPEVKAAMEEAGVSDASGHIPYWVAPLGEVWHQLIAAPDNPFRQQGVDLLSATDPPEVRIAQALAAPLKALGVEAKGLKETDAFGHYILAMIPGLLILGREYGRQWRRKIQDIKDEEE